MRFTTKNTTTGPMKNSARSTLVMSLIDSPSLMAMMSLPAAAHSTR